MLTDRDAMARALLQAECGVGRTSPNPPVGCVVLDLNRRLVGEGYYPYAGGPHAEAVALAQAGERARGGSIFVTLEPCSHYGRTPPCVEAVIGAGIRRVVAAIRDPDARVSGAGFRRLRSAGLEVIVGPGAARARRIQEGYLKVRTTGLPFVLLKMAMTLDGKIATASGDSRWVSSTESRSYVQVLRDRYDSVMVGAGTVRTDDPQLTVRPGQLPPGYPRQPRNPLRVVVDSRASLSPSARLVHEPGRSLLLTTGRAECSRIKELESAGVEVSILEEENGRVPLRPALLRLAESGIHTVLLEGGPVLAAAMLSEGLVDRMLLFVAPKLLGGRDAPGPIADLGLHTMAEAWPTGRMTVRRYGSDLALIVNPPSRPG